MKVATVKSLLARWRPVGGGVWSRGPVSPCGQLLWVGLAVFGLPAVAAGQDLVVSSFAAPSTGSVGKTLSGVVATVRNQGTAQAGPLRVGFYYSTSPTFSFSSAVYSGWYCTNATGLAISTTWSCGGEVGIPSLLSPGIYYLFAVADDLNQVTESNEGNNWRSADGGTVRLTGGCSVLPISVGQTVGGTLTTSSCPSGANSTSYAQMYWFTLTSTQTLTIDLTSTAFDTYLVVLDSLNTKLDHDHGSGGNLNSEITRSFSPGTYYIEASSWASNQTGPFTLSLTTAGGPDLVVASFTAPTSGTLGGTLSAAAVTVLNQGHTNAGPFRVGFYYSTSPTFSFSLAVYSGTNCADNSELSSSANWSCSVDIRIPSSLSPGTYYLFAVADDQSQVTESNEGNNWRSAGNGTVSLINPPPPGADLVVTSLTAPTTGSIGGTLSSVAVAVLNQGGVSAGPYRVGFYYSTSLIFSFSSAVHSGWSCTNSTGLAISTTRSCSGEVGIPSSLSPGVYYLFAVADDQSQVAESNEGNNWRSADTGRISLTKRLSFDYIKSGVSNHVEPGGAIQIPDSIGGTSAKVQFWVTNVSGASQSVASVTVTGTGFSLSGVPPLPVTLSSSQPGAQLNFDVVFKPTSPGTYAGTLTIDDYSFPLSAVGVPNPFSFQYLKSGVSPSSPVSPGETIPLPDATVGGGSTSSQFWITNMSGVAQSIQTITVSGAGFSSAGLPSLPVTLLGAQPGAQLNFDVKFQPTTPGNASGTLTINGDTFQLSGKGTLGAVTFTGLSDPVQPAQQPSFTVQLGSAPGVDLNGTLTLSFAPDAVTNPADDPNIRIMGATGAARSLSFTVPASATSAQFTLASTGTVAGTITLRATFAVGGQDVTPATVPSQTVHLVQQAPTISSVTISNRTAAGFSVEVSGYSTTRDLTQAKFSFAGTDLQTRDFTVALTSQSTAWFGGSASAQSGGAFKYTQAFTVSQGSTNNITSVSVTLTNAQGDSQPKSAGF